MRNLRPGFSITSSGFRTETRHTCSDLNRPHRRRSVSTIEPGSCGKPLRLYGPDSKEITETSSGFICYQNLKIPGYRNSRRQNLKLFVAISYKNIRPARPPGSLASRALKTSWTVHSGQ